MRAWLVGLPLPEPIGTPVRDVVMERCETGSTSNLSVGVDSFEVNELLLMTGGLDLDAFSSQLGQFLVIAAQSN